MILSYYSVNQALYKGSDLSNQMEIALLNENYVYGFTFVLHRMAYRTGNNSRKITY